MNQYILIRIIGAAGIILVLFGYYMLWIPPEAPLNEVITRTKAGILLNIFGVILFLYYMYKK